MNRIRFTDLEIELEVRPRARSLIADSRRASQRWPA